MIERGRDPGGWRRNRGTSARGGAAVNNRSRPDRRPVGPSLEAGGKEEAATGRRQTIPEDPPHARGPGEAGVEASSFSVGNRSQPRPSDPHTFRILRAIARPDWGRAPEPALGPNSGKPTTMPRACRLARASRPPSKATLQGGSRASSSSSGMVNCRFRRLTVAPVGPFVAPADQTPCSRSSF